jgi:exonuclease III
MISWIPSGIDIIYLAETWEHEESKVPNMEGFVLWSAWNKKSHRRGIGGIACYIRKNISPGIQLHKIDPLNQYIWIEISDTNAKKMYIAICYFSPINSTFYKKNNLDKNCPYNNLEQDIYNLENEGNILLLGDFNARIATKQATLLSDDSNHNPLWLDEDLVLSNSYKRSSEDLIENLFGTKLVKLCNSQDLIICNGVMKWPNSNQMTCIHGLGSSVVDYVISDIPVSNQITFFDLLNDHELDSDHKPLNLTLKFSMHRSTIEENYDNQRNLHFDKSKVDIFLKGLDSKLKLLTYKDNIEELYHNFTTTLSTSINKFSFEVSHKKNNRTTNPWYDKECKIARKSIRDASNEPLKLDKISTYKALIKRKKKILYQ